MLMIGTDILGEWINGRQAGHPNLTLFNLPTPSVMELSSAASLFLSGVEQAT